MLTDPWSDRTQSAAMTAARQPSSGGSRISPARSASASHALIWKLLCDAQTFGCSTRAIRYSGSSVGNDSGSGGRSLLESGAAAAGGQGAATAGLRHAGHVPGRDRVDPPFSWPGKRREHAMQAASVPAGTIAGHWKERRQPPCEGVIGNLRERRFLSSGRLEGIPMIPFLCSNLHDLRGHERDPADADRAGGHRTGRSVV
jgi:hypothetical protein